MGISIGLKATFPSLGLARQWVNLALVADPYQWNRRRNGTEQPGRFVTEEPYLGLLAANTRLFVRETSFLIPRAGSSMG